ncbi:DNA polymerase theta [Holothuria leucospilota]|uniref:DNA polymerase theta n=1 Tax=Holothuria leucospilota TaxID=206669 RepID=A0A9Q1B9D3_HOLLE|nr:DNA polymerase theta [Holothuria leucospilota]
METLKEKLKESDLYSAFREIEMPSIITLIHVELNGIGFSHEECETQKVFMQSKLTALEEQAYLLAGRTFSLTSPDDIAQVLYLELKLPPTGEVRNSDQGRVAMPTRKTLGGRGRGQMAKHFSTSKEALEKIKNLHPLPG